MAAVLSTRQRKLHVTFDSIADDSAVSSLRYELRHLYHPSTGPELQTNFSRLLKQISHEKEQSFAFFASSISADVECGCQCHQMLSNLCFAVYFEISGKCEEALFSWGKLFPPLLEGSGG